MAKCCRWSRLTATKALRFGLAGILSESESGAFHSPPEPRGRGRRGGGGSAAGWCGLERGRRLGEDSLDVPKRLTRKSTPTVTVKALTFATRDLPLESWDSGRSLTRMSDRRNGSQIEVCWAAGRRCRATARLVTGPGAAAVTELPDTSRGRGELAQAEPHSG